jgi:hypothetical protein
MRDTYISLQGLVIAFFIVILLFIPIPVIGRFICLWILFVVICNLVSGDILFSLFISTFIVILFFIYLGPKKTIFGNTIEKFDGGDGGDGGEVDDKLNNEMEINESVPEKAPAPAPEKELKDMNPTQLNNIVNKLNVSASPSKDDDEDLFGKLDIGDYEDEDSDEDSDEDEDEDKIENKVGKTTSSSKKAYKAQKQLYDLNNTANALHKTLTRMGPTLEKGQKIIDTISKMGITKYL